MTCRLSESSWLDVLYGCVRRTDGGVEDAARFLTLRRGRSISASSLRNKLRGLEGESLSVEMADLLTEWMRGKVVAQGYARDWIEAFAAVHQMAAMPVDGVATVSDIDLAAVVTRKVLGLVAVQGDLSGAAVAGLADGRLDARERDAMLSRVREVRDRLARLEQVLLRREGMV